MLQIIPYPNHVEIRKGFLDLPIKPNKNIIDTSLSEEEYCILVDENGIQVRAREDKGFFYAQQTLLQLYKQFKDKLPFMLIQDKPKYSHRGYMLDCSRHFFTVKEIKKQIDILAKLKINVFHWHLTDDQGWRIEIDKYPLLTTVGARRAQTQGDGIVVEGYYSKKDIKEVVEYCRKNYIDVIPEIDMPGHFRAAIAAYPELSCTENKITVGEGFGISPHIACAGKEKVYEFIYNVLDEIVELFPYEYIHLGGDEALKLNWIGCKFCQKAIKINGLKNEEELQGYFMSNLIRYLNAKEKKVINWNDGMLGGNTEGQLIVQYWKETKACEKVVLREVEKGRKVIISPFFRYYLDYPHGMTSLRKVYNYEVNIIEETAVLGLEAPLWTEHVKDINKLEEMTYPRLIAVAERSWTEKNMYKSFLTRLENFYNILNDYNINYNRRPNPSFLKGKWEMLKFFLRAFKAVDKGNLKAMAKTKKLLKTKYKKG